MPYRILCNAVQREGAKLSPALAPEPFCYVPLHKIRYGIRIFWGTDTVEVELKPFNDRALNRDVMILCTKVAQDQPHLPDGRRLLFRK